MTEDLFFADNPYDPYQTIYDFFIIDFQKQLKKLLATRTIPTFDDFSFYPIYSLFQGVRVSRLLNAQFNFDLKHSKYTELANVTDLPKNLKNIDLSTRLDLGIQNLALNDHWLDSQEQNDLYFQFKQKGFTRGNLFRSNFREKKIESLISKKLLYNIDHPFHCLSSQVLRFDLLIKTKVYLDLVGTFSDN